MRTTPDFPAFTLARRPACTIACALFVSACKTPKPPPGDSLAGPETPPASASANLPAPRNSSPEARSTLPSATPPAAETEKPYVGPLLGAIVMQAPVQPSVDFSKKRIGYLRHGSKVPVDATPIKNSSCTSGWYHLVDGGYVCGKHGTLDLTSPQVKLGITAPNLDDVLPYKYAHNTAHGTPLYRSVPSKEEMIKYEPYLEIAKRARRKAKKEDADEVAPQDVRDKEKPARPEPVEAPAEPSALPDEAASDAIPPEETKPWWQQNDASKPLNVTLAGLEEDADSTLAKRMVKGFFVAVDKTFGWNGRLWYKTTAALVAPAERMYLVKPPTSQGISFPDGVKQIGFATSSKAVKYVFDAEMKKITSDGPAPRLAAFALTGETHTYKSVIYRKTADGWWLKGIDGTYTDPGPPPPDLAAGEKWIDVNLTRKTLVSFEGDKPVYAALISPGKRSKIKAKDHPTVQGLFRIREKHITVTMDGDGTVAGDLPYSIEDVPYVSYFEGSYALHGAFWHNNFGHEMSHGCVNLSPLDAKWIFFWSEPRLPRGWHGVWATSENRGTVVVVHE